MSDRNPCPTCGVARYWWPYCTTCARRIASSLRSAMYRRATTPKDTHP